MKNKTLILSFCTLLSFIGVFASSSLALIQERDARGKRIILSRAPQRIISLAPSVTEILYELGLEGQVVGVTDACDYPPQVRKKPRIGGVLLNFEKIVALKPDLVIGIWGLQRKNILQLERMGIKVFVIDPHSFQDTLESILKIGRLTGRAERAEILVKAIHQRLDSLRNKLKKVRSRPKVLFIVSWEPLYVAGPGTFVDDAIRLAGGRNVVVGAKGSFPALSKEQVVLYKPDVLFFTTREALILAEKDPSWRTIPAVRSHRLYVVNPDLLTRPGPRLIQGIEQLYRYLRSFP